MTTDKKTDKPLNQQRWKMAASGSGVIVCRPYEQGLRVLLARRGAIVGQGYGITGGGFIECGGLLMRPIGTVIQTADEAFREACEENQGFEDVIDADSFLERAQPVSLIHARIDDLNEVHTAAMYALSASGSEWTRFKALPPGIDENGKVERDGALMEYFVTWSAPIDRREPERYVIVADGEGRQLRMDDFFHRHEFHAIAAIAWHQQNGKLW